MDKYTNSLVDEIKETVEALEKHWVCKIDEGMYWTPRVGLKACFEVIQKRAKELEEQCDKQWLKIQGDTEHIADLEAKLAGKDEENLILFSMLYETLEKQGYENITSTIEQMTNLTLEKQSNWLKENCVKNQDKISFAVEQLTQAIKNIKKCNYKDFGIMYQSDAIAIIDNQIKQLKEKQDV